MYSAVKPAFTDFLLFLDLFARPYSGRPAGRGILQRDVQRARQRAVHESCVVISAEFHALFVLSFFFLFLPQSEQVRACVRVLAHVRACVSLCGLGWGVPYVPSIRMCSREERRAFSATEQLSCRRPRLVPPSRRCNARAAQPVHPRPRPRCNRWRLRDRNQCGLHCPKVQ